MASLASTRVVKGNKQGDTELRVSFDGVSARVPLHVLPERPHELSFINDIVPIFTRADCANSNCHGSVRGQKGFKLSLFGSDPNSITMRLRRTGMAIASTARTRRRVWF